VSPILSGSPRSDVEIQTAFLLANINPSPTVNRLKVTRPSRLIFSFKARMALVVSSCTAASATAPFPQHIIENNEAAGSDEL